MAYEINININGNVNDIQTGGGKTTSAVSQSEQTNKTLKSLGKYIVAQSIKPMIQQTVGYVTSNVELYTGSRSQQQKADLIMEGVSLGTQAYSNAMGGVALATSIGMSAGAGVGIGLALTAVQIGMDLLFKHLRLQEEKRQEDRQRDYLYSRSGMAYSRSRRGA